MKQAKQSESLEAMRHTAAHVLAAAVLDLWPEAKLTLGPPIEDGFYYDIEFQAPISEADLPKIEKHMKKILPKWTEFTHEEVPPEMAQKLFADNPYKLELINEIANRGEIVTLYTCGGFTDLCRGGHLERPSKELKHFKLLSIAGAYWRGDEKNQMLTRIYGTTFPTQEELEEFLQMKEEAKKRDHRKLGQQLDLFTFSPLVGSGLPLFTPKGTVIRRELERFLQSIQEPLGYQAVTIPHLARPELYKTSGHWDKFQEDLFHVRGKHDEQFVMKPMNCPHHTQIYASKPRSYRDLPLRFSEVTMVYRDEQAGQLQGLSRVRSITQDDAHVFCRSDQVKEEIERVLQIVDTFYSAFSLQLSFRLSLWDDAHPEKYLGTPELWEKAQNTLGETLKARGADFSEAAGEAAFYGPKIDFMAKDSLGRTWQMATVQLDFNQPKRFELTYIDETGKEQTPVMIHRAIAGAYERFIAIILEHYAGALPLWLSPVQVAVLPISDEQIPYAEEVARQLRELSPSMRGAGLRVEVDARPESIGKKIREAQMQKAPYMLIVGKKEVADNVVAIRSREKGDEGTQSLEGFLSQIRAAITQKN